MTQYLIELEDRQPPAHVAVDALAESWPIPLLGGSPAIARVRGWLVGLAPLRTPVLFSGERGTGRSAAAGWLHRSGPIPTSVFQVVDAGASRRAVSLPIRGTVLLEGLERLGTEGQKAWIGQLGRSAGDLRIVATAGLSFGDLLHSDAFDPELARRFTRFEVGLPALRERLGDLPSLVDAYAHAASLEFGRPCPTFASGALRRLSRERWPGNLAELRQVVERLIAYCPGPEIEMRDVDAVLEDARPTLDALRRRQQSAEREELLRHLEETGGNVAQTALRMGRSRPSIYRLVEKHGIALR